MHESYGRATSSSNITSKLRPSSSNSNRPETFPPHSPGSSWTPGGSMNDTLVVDKHANATFVILARNSDLQSTVRGDRFNRRFRHQYVFLNEEPFTSLKCVYFSSRLFSPIVAEDFILDSWLSVLSSAKMEFGLIIGFNRTVSG